jgi:hypothetical protein
MEPHGAATMSSKPAVSPHEERLRRIVMIVRQGLYFIADEFGKEFGLHRPCKRCEEQRRRSGQPREMTQKTERAA